MTELSVPQAYEVLRFSEQFRTRLQSAESLLSGRRDLARETGWLADAAALLAERPEGLDRALADARALPELAELAGDLEEEARGQWIDALERLMAGFVFHAGSRSPIIEAIFGQPKFPQLRRNRDAAQAYATELERRLKAGYVVRMLSGEDLAFAPPVLETVAAARARWQASQHPSPPPEEQAAALRRALLSAADRVQLALGQAKLLAEAALLPLPGAFAEAGLQAKPKKRAGPPAVEERAKPGAEPTAGPLEDQSAEPPESAGAGESPEGEAAPAPSRPEKGKRRAEARDAAGEPPSTPARPPRTRKPPAPPPG